MINRPVSREYNPWAVKTEVVLVRVEFVLDARSQCSAHLDLSKSENEPSWPALEATLVLRFHPRVTIGTKSFHSALYCFSN